MRSNRSVLFSLLLGLLVLLMVPASSDAASGSKTARTITVYNPSGVRESGQFVDEVLLQSMKTQNISRPRDAARFPKARTETVPAKSDGYDEINELFYRRGWTDGLPIVPPTPERVAHMLEGADFSPEDTVATLDPMGGKATIEKIAVNAVMAGCLPAHLPLLIAAVEAASRPEFDLRGVTTTTNPDAPLMIVSGPFVKDLGINSGTNAFGRGWRANTTISRAFHLILQNVGGSWPGVTDMSTMGQPGDIVMLFAENAEANPWEPIHQALGLPAAANAVTVVSAESFSGILGIGQTRPGFLNLIASWMKGHDRPYRSDLVIVIAQDTARMLAQEGWTKASIEAYLRNKAKVPFKEFKEQFIDTNMASINRGVPAWAFKVTDPEQLVDKPFVDRFLIVVAGGTGEKSMLIPGWAGGRAVCQEVRLPANWKELTAESRE
ncbi:MAG: hypothetical protein ABFD97_25335 [Syntrophobacter sp.]